MQPQLPVFEQHPVPQNISSYQFRLVGDMTIKQFFELAGGGLVSLLFYASPLPSFLKWPFIIFFVLLGAALAFLPIQERPLEQWLIAFIRSVYTPTLYYWQKPTSPRIYYQTSTPTAETLTSPKTPHAGKPDFLNHLEGAEEAILGQVQNIFKTISSQIPQSQPTPTTPVVPTIVAQNLDVAAHQPKPTTIQSSTFSAPIKAVLTGSTQTPLQQVSAPSLGQIVSEEKQSLFPQASPTPQLKPSLTVPVSSTPDISAMGYSLANAPINPITPIKTETLFPVTPTLTTPQATSAQFSPQASPPIPPTQPNIIVGQAIDSENRIISGAILEIKDLMGRSVRALRTNNAGHFLIVTPLANGVYKLFVEKEGFKFEPIQINVTGAIIPPIAIKAKSI